MTKTQWSKHVNELIGAIDADRDLDDLDYLEVLDDLTEKAGLAAEVKREEIIRKRTRALG